MASTLLNRHRAAIDSRWLQMILESYPAQTSRFLLDEPDQFLNPVGSNIARDVKTILDEIEGEMVEERLSSSLDSLMAIRAVQDCPPSRAVGVIFFIKRLALECARDEPWDAWSLDELMEIETRVDRVAVMAFDHYMKRREKIFELRVREASMRGAVILARLNRLSGISEEQQGI